MLRSGFELHQPPLSALKSFMAPTADMFYVTHLGIVGMSSAGWSLKIGGLVEQPVTLSRAHLQKFPARHIVAVHEYAGSPLAPTTPVRLVGNVEWQGGRLQASAPMQASCRRLRRH